MSDPFHTRYQDIDPLFSSRRRPTDAEIEEIIWRFVNETLSLAEADAAIERLARRKKGVQPRLLEMVASPDPALYQTAAVLLVEINMTGAIRPLRKLLENPELEDDHKISILRALQALGGLSREENPLVYLRDPEAFFRKSQEAILNSFQDPMKLEMALHSILEGDVPVRQQPGLLLDMARSQDRRVLPLLLCLLHAPDDEIVINAIEALAILQDPGATPIIEERARYDPSPRVCQVAGEVFTRVVPGSDAPPTSILDLPVAPPPLVRCLISTIDGSGSQVVLIIRRDSRDEENYLMWDVMFNDHEGIKDCFGGQSYIEYEIEDMIAEGLADMGIETVEISLDRAREEIQRAYQFTLETRRRLPPNYMGWESWLQGEDPEPVEVFPLPEVAPDEQAILLERCYELTELDEFESWFFNPDELHGLEREFGRLSEQADTFDTIEDLISQGIRTVVDDRRRRLLRERLLRQAWLLAQIYEEEELPKLALAAAAGLSDDAPLPIEVHPLLREMMFDSFFNAVEWGEQNNYEP